MPLPGEDARELVLTPLTTASGIPGSRNPNQCKMRQITEHSHARCPGEPEVFGLCLREPWGPVGGGGGGILRGPSGWAETTPPTNQSIPAAMYFLHAVSYKI